MLLTPLKKYLVLYILLLLQLLREEVLLRLLHRSQRCLHEGARVLTGK